MQLSLNYRFLILLAGALALLALVLNLVLSHLLWLPDQTLPLWGPQSIAMHLFTFSTITGFGLGWIATMTTRWALRSGRVLPLHWHLKSQTLVDQLPSRTFSRAFMFALAGLAIGAIMIMLLDTLQLYAIPYPDFQVLSSIYSFCLSVAITSMGVYRAMSDTMMRHTRV